MPGTASGVASREFRWAESRPLERLLDLRPMSKLNWVKLAAIVALASIVGSAGAQQAMTSYDVELVIFRNLSGNATPEAWDKPAGNALSVPDDDDSDSEAGAANEGAPLATTTETFPSLSPDKMKLGAIADSLRRSRNYQTLAHFGWTQPGYPRTEAHYMSIEPLVGAGSGLTGQVAMSRGRYLHLTLDLSLQPPGSTERFILRQTRRMRSNERHYIDHPKFGVIALITPSR